MSKKEHVSATPATMWLKQHKVPFEDGIYEYVEHGGTAPVELSAALSAALELDNQDFDFITLHGDGDRQEAHSMREAGGIFSAGHLLPSVPPLLGAV